MERAERCEFCGEFLEQGTTSEEHGCFGDILEEELDRVNGMGNIAEGGLEDVGLIEWVEDESFVGMVWLVCWVFEYVLLEIVLDVVEEVIFGRRCW